MLVLLTEFDQRQRALWFHMYNTVLVEVQKWICYNLQNGLTISLHVLLLLSPLYSLPSWHVQTFNDFCTYMEHILVKIYLPNSLWALYFESHVRSLYPTRSHHLFFHCYHFFFPGTETHSILSYLLLLLYFFCNLFNSHSKLGVWSSIHWQAFPANHGCNQVVCAISCQGWAKSRDRHQQSLLTSSLFLIVPNRSFTISVTE